MPMTPERKFRLRASRDLKEIPASWFESIQQKAIHGTPDMLGCVNGHFVALEFKKSIKDKPKGIQKHKLEQISEAYGRVYVPCPENWVEVLEELTKLSRRKL